MAIDRNQIRDLLGSGLSNDLVATAVGCSPSYISQLMSEEAFADEVVAMRASALQANSRRDRGIDGIEEKLIEKLEDVVPSLFKPADVLRAFAVLNAAKRRGVSAHESLVINQQVVNLNIPKVVHQKFVLSKEGEVIEVSGQTLVTKSSAELLRELVAQGGDDAGEYKKALSFLPSGLEVGSSNYRLSNDEQTNALKSGNAFKPVSVRQDRKSSDV